MLRQKVPRVSAGKPAHLLHMAMYPMLYIRIHYKYYITYHDIIRLKCMYYRDKQT